MRLRGLAAARGFGLLSCVLWCACAWSAPAAATAPAVDRSPTWASLTLQQQQTLAPLQREWAATDATRKQKWIEIASRFPNMPADERQRVRERMAEWARMTPAERAEARLLFQAVRTLPAAERQAKWRAYQALPPDERRALAQQARPGSAAVSSGLRSPIGGSARLTADGGTGTAAVGTRDASSAAAGGGVKRNPPPSPATQPLIPPVLQAKPGATTTTLSTPRAPPPHHRPGAPKIAATPRYVDPATLLPKRGPQSAAIGAAAPADVDDDGPP